MDKIAYGTLSKNVKRTLEILKDLETLTEDERLTRLPEIHRNIALLLDQINFAIVTARREERRHFKNFLRLLLDGAIAAGALAKTVEVAGRFAKLF